MMSELVLIWKSISFGPFKNLLLHLMFNKGTHVDQEAWKYMKKTRVNASVNTPRRMVTCSQTQAAAKSRRNEGVNRPDP